MEERSQQQQDRRLSEQPAIHKPTDLSPRSSHYTSPIHHSSMQHTVANRHNTSREETGCHNISTSSDKHPSPKHSPITLPNAHSSSFNTSKTSPQSSTGSTGMPASCERQPYPLPGSICLPGSTSNTSPYISGYGSASSPEQMYYPHHSSGLITSMPSMSTYPYPQMSYLSHNNACALNASGTNTGREAALTGYHSNQSHVSNTLPSCTYMGSQTYGLFPSNMSSGSSIPS